MLKETISYEDFDGVTRTDVLYFNITKAELLDNLHLQAELLELQRMMTASAGTEMGEPEVREMLKLVKTFMKLSYGERSEDGKRFSKRPEVWENFTETSAYDAYLLSLFEDPEKAVRFLVEIIPRDLRPEVQQAVANQGINLPDSPALSSVPVAPASKDAEPTDEELLAMKPQDMTTEQLRRAFSLKGQ